MYLPEEYFCEPIDLPIQLSEEISEECEKKLGITNCNVQVIAEHAAEGMCTVKFRSEFEAKAAAKLMNGRLFNGMTVSATIYDGSFPIPRKSEHSQRPSEEQSRLDAFSKFIEQNAEESNEDNDEEEYSDNSEESSDPDDDDDKDSESDEL